MMVLNSGGIGATEKLAEARSFSDGGGDLPEATTGTYERYVLAMTLDYARYANIT